MEPIGAFVKCNQVWWREEIERDREGEGKRGMNSLSRDKISSEHQLCGDKDQNMSLLQHEYSWRERRTKATFKKPNMIFKPLMILLAAAEMLHSQIAEPQMHKFSEMPWGQILIKGKRHCALHFWLNYEAISFLLLFSKPIKRSTRSE